MFSYGVGFHDGRMHLGKKRDTVWATVEHRDNPFYRTAPESEYSLRLPMLLAQVRHQGFIGTSTLLAQAAQFLRGHPRIVTKSSWDIQHNVHKEPDLALVSSEQLVARFTDHVAITATPGSSLTKSVCGSGKLPGSFRIRVLECV